MKKNKIKKPVFHLPEPKEKLKALLKRLEINTKECDYLLIGDGSGSQRHLPSGWYATLIDIAGQERIPFYGFVNRASINYAELLAYLAPLCEILHRVLDERKANNGRIDFKHVHIVTDSEYVQKMAERAHDRVANMPVWDAIELIKRQGVIVHWHWYGRETIELNSLADAGSKLARRQGQRLIKELSREIYQPTRYNQDG